MNEKKILFACDLDNTLLISHRDKHPDYICVEIYQGKEQSFMTRKSAELLQIINKKVHFIPVTTRSMEQYKRIEWPAGSDPKYAVTTNGAVLFRNGIAEDYWLQETMEEIKDEKAEIISQFEKQSASGEYLICRIVDESYLFLCCENEEVAEKKICELKVQTKLKVERTGRKIYLFPQKLDKGAALERLKRKLNVDFVFAAGDSEMDAPMLNKANVAFAPEVSRGKVKDSCLFSPTGVIFSEWFLREFIKKSYSFS